MSARLALTRPLPDADRDTHAMHGGTLRGAQENHDAAKESHKQMKTAAMIEAAEHARNRPRDVEALHHMWASRPLKPPPYDFGPARGRAGLIAVREDRKAGVLV